MDADETGSQAHKMYKWPRPLSRKNKVDKIS